MINDCFKCWAHDETSLIHCIPWIRTKKSDLFTTKIVNCLGQITKITDHDLFILSILSIPATDRGTHVTKIYHLNLDFNFKRTNHVLLLTTIQWTILIKFMFLINHTTKIIIAKFQNSSPATDRGIHLAIFLSKKNIHLELDWNFERTICVVLLKRCHERYLCTWTLNEKICFNPFETMPSTIFMQFIV